MMVTRAGNKKLFVKSCKQGRPRSDFFCLSRSFWQATLEHLQQFMILQVYEDMLARYEKLEAQIAAKYDKREK